MIAHDDNRQFYERMAARPATIAPDALASRPKALAIETVSDTKVLTDGTRRLEIYDQGQRSCRRDADDLLSE